MQKQFLGLIFVLQIIFCSGLFSQQNTDSLLQIINTSKDNDVLMITYNNYAYRMYRTNPDTAIYYAHLSIDLADRQKNNKEIASNYNLLGLAYQSKGLYNLSLSNFNKAVELQKNDKLNQAKTFHNMALVYQSMNNKNEALKYDLEAIKVAEQQSDSVIIGVVYQTLCNIYRDLGDYALAETYILKSIRIFENVKNTGRDNRLSMLANAHTNYGNLLQVTNRLNEATAQQLKAISIHNNSGDLYNQAIAYENLGNNYLSLNKYTEALEQYETAKQLMQKVNSATDVGYELMNIADVYKLTGRFNLALVNLDSALQIFTASGADAFRRDVYRKKYEIYDEIKNPEQALAFYKLFNKINDSINSEAKKSEVLRLKEEFESTQKEKEIALLKTDNALKDKEKQLQIVFRNIAVGLLIFLGLTGFLLINRYRIKQQVKQLEMRNKIASDLHDDIGSTLSSISMYSDIIKNQLDQKQSSTILLLDKMRSNSTDMIENMSDIVWAIKPANDVFNKIETRMFNFATEITSLNNIELHMERNPALENIKIPMEQRRDLYLIFKEAVNNSVKYAQCTLLKISFHTTAKMLHMEIADNGIGFNKNVSNSDQSNPSSLGGNGLKNMQQRADRNHAKLHIESIIGKGTTVILELPLD